MYNKGTWGYPLQLVTYGILLAIILIFYGTIFFATNASKSEVPTISASDYQDSTTLINLLKTKIEVNNKNMTIIEAIHLANNYQITEEELKKPINGLLFKLPQIENKQSYYVLNIKKHDKVFLEFGEIVITSKEYLKQQITLPLENNENAIIEFYYTCSGCTEKEIEEVLA